MTLSILAAVGVALCGAYSVGTIGATGGPNHGEHPLICTVVHGAVFAFVSGDWPPFSRELYGALLVLALVAAVVALRLTPAIDDAQRRKLWPPRIAIALVYVGLLAVYFARPQFFGS